ncbi:hypothetical protein ACTA71_004347 [Dictyostelium dimigraforme]
MNKTKGVDHIIKKVMFDASRRDNPIKPILAIEKTSYTPLVYKSHNGGNNINTIRFFSDGTFKKYSPSAKEGRFSFFSIDKSKNYNQEEVAICLKSISGQPIATCFSIAEYLGFVKKVPVAEPTLHPVDPVNPVYEMLCVGNCYSNVALKLKPPTIQVFNFGRRSVPNSFHNKFVPIPNDEELTAPVESAHQQPSKTQITQINCGDESEFETKTSQETTNHQQQHKESEDKGLKIINEIKLANESYLSWPTITVIIDHKGSKDEYKFSQPTFIKDIHSLLCRLKVYPRCRYIEVIDDKSGKRKVEHCLEGGLAIFKNKILMNKIYGFIELIMCKEYWFSTEKHNKTTATLSRFERYNDSLKVIHNQCKNYSDEFNNYSRRDSPDDLSKDGFEGFITKLGRSIGSSENKEVFNIIEYQTIIDSFKRKYMETPNTKLRDNLKQIKKNIILVCFISNFVNPNHTNK